MSYSPSDPSTDPWAVRAIDAPIVYAGNNFAPTPYSFDNLPDIPATRELKGRRQWVAWKHEVRDGQPTKLPVNPHSNRNAKVNKPETWGSYDEAVKCALKFGHAGVGYVLIKDDDISGHDLDKVIDPVTGALPEWVQEIIDLGETYTEVSPSGRGIRMFWRGKLPAAIKLDAAQVEIYSSGRYLTVTGHRIAGTSDEIANAPKTLELLQARVEQFKEAEARTRSEAVIIPASGPQVKSARKAGSTSNNPFWRNVKDAALADLASWVPDLFGAETVYQPGTGAWRISSATLGRGLEEDLSIHPDGIQDFGTEEGLTAIDLVMWRRGGTDKDAAFWLCDRMRRTPESMGWDHNNAGRQKLITHLLDAGHQQQARNEGPFADEARETLRLHLEKLMASALAWHATSYSFGDIDLGKPTPPHDAIKMTVGTGKSRAIRRMIARFIRRARLKGLPHRVLYAVSTHKLASEAQKMMLEGITTTVWQGRGGTKINTGDPGDPMCPSPERVEAAKATGSDIERTACRKKRRGQPAILCPFYPCHYQRQKVPASKADVVLCAHELLFKAPPAIGDGFGLIVVDEAFWAKGLSGVATKSRLLISGLADDLKSTPVLDRGAIDPYQTMELRDLVGRLQSAFDAMPDGYVTRQQLIDAGLTRADPLNRSCCETAEALEWARKPRRALLQPNSSAEQRNKAVAKYSGLGRVKQRVAMWKELGALIEGNKPATGRLRLETVKTEDGEQRYIRVLRRKKILEKFAGLPLIHLDATMPFELVKHYLPELQLGLDLEVKAPHMRLTQIAGLPVGKSSLQPLEPGKRAPEKELEAAGKRKRLVNVVRHLTGGRRGLLVAQMSIEGDFKGIDGLETAYGAIEGRDCWKDVEVEVIIGRPLPSRRTIENYAAALTGRPVIAGEMIEQIRPLGTTGHALRCKVYANPDAEMIRQAIAEAGVRQAEGRVRAVNRTRDNPVEVYVILSDTVVPGMPVDQAVNFQDIEPDAVDLMIGRGITLEAGTDAHTLCPDLFPSPEAARVAIHRAGLDVRRGIRRRGHQTNSVTFSYNELFIRECNADRFRVVRYQKTGTKQKSWLALIDLVKFRDPRAALAALEPLARFEVIEPMADAAE